MRDCPPTPILIGSSKTRKYRRCSEVLLPVGVGTSSHTIPGFCCVFLPPPHTHTFSSSSNRPRTLAASPLSAFISQWRTRTTATVVSARMEWFWYRTPYCVGVLRSTLFPDDPTDYFVDLTQPKHGDDEWNETLRGYGRGRGSAAVRAYNIHIAWGAV